MFIHLHSKETDKLFVVNTDYIVTICDTEYDDSPTPLVQFSLYLGMKDLGRGKRERCRYCASCEP